MKPIYSIRPAIKPDCKMIAELYRISSDGVADYIWTLIAKPNEDVLLVGQKRYQQESSNFSYRNCWVVDIENEVVGMLVAFPMLSPDSDESLANQETDPILAPYNELEEYDSFYICGVALLSKYRRFGIGKKLMALAEAKCVEMGLTKLSLIVFDQNTEAKKLYQTLGYETVKTAEVVPHPLIHFTGLASLMVKHLE